MRVLFSILDIGRPTHEILNTTFYLVEYALNARAAEELRKLIKNGTQSTSPHIRTLSGGSLSPERHTMVAYRRG